MTFSGLCILGLDFSSACIACTFCLSVFLSDCCISGRFHKEKDRHPLIDERIAGPYALAKISECAQVLVSMRAVFWIQSFGSICPDCLHGLYKPKLVLCFFFGIFLCPYVLFSTLQDQEQLRLFWKLAEMQAQIEKRLVERFCSFVDFFLAVVLSKNVFAGIDCFG